MTDADYKETLDGVRSELEDVLNEELKIERRLMKLRERSEALGKAAQGLAGLVGEDQEEESIGITDSIRKILRDGSDHIWKPTAVRFRLKSEGFLLEKYQNPLAVIHTTLKRLEGPWNRARLRPSRTTGKLFISGSSPKGSQTTTFRSSEEEKNRDFKWGCGETENTAVFKTAAWSSLWVRVPPPPPSNPAGCANTLPGS